MNNLWNYIIVATIFLICPIKTCVIEYRNRIRREVINEIQPGLNEIILIDEFEDFSRYMIKIKNIIKHDDCIICYENMDKNIVMLHCGHKYHRDCINEWLNYKDSCPMCRKCCRF